MHHLGLRVGCQQRPDGHEAIGLGDLEHLVARAHDALGHDVPAVEVVPNGRIDTFDLALAAELDAVGVVDRAEPSGDLAVLEGLLGVGAGEHRAHESIGVVHPGHDLGCRELLGRAVVHVLGVGRAGLGHDLPVHGHSPGKHRVVHGVPLGLRNPGEALGDHAHVEEVDLLHALHVAVGNVAEQPEHLLEHGVRELAPQAVLEVADRVKQVSQRADGVPAEWGHHGAVRELDVHELEDVPAVAAVSGVEQPLVGRLHIADAAVVLVHDDPATPRRVVAVCVQEVEIVAPQHWRGVAAPVTGVLLEVLLDLLGEVLSRPIVDLKAGGFAFDHVGQQLIHQLHIPAGIYVLSPGHPDQVCRRERRVDGEVRQILHRGERIGRDQDVLSTASRRAPVAVTQPGHRADAVQHRRGELGLEHGRELRRPLHHSVQLLGDDVAPLRTLVAGADVQPDREVILRLQERVRELLAGSMDDPGALQKVDVRLDAVVARLLGGVWRVAVEHGVDAGPVSRARLFRLEHGTDDIPNF